MLTNIAVNDNVGKGVCVCTYCNGCHFLRCLRVTKLKRAGWFGERCRKAISRLLLQLSISFLPLWTAQWKQHINIHSARFIQRIRPVNLLKITIDDIPVQNTGTSQSINYRYHTGTNFRIGNLYYLNVWTNFDMVRQPLAPGWVWWVRTDMVSSLVFYTQSTSTAISGRKLTRYGHLWHQAECSECTHGYFWQQAECSRCTHGYFWQQAEYNECALMFWLST